ncbi:MAG: hypothetical protein LBH81_00430 [Rickettsiales bacterium]|jgi:hypothetical protein|nr:hypothetical protein [Rickettsiales bacterium]
MRFIATAIFITALAAPAFAEDCKPNEFKNKNGDCIACNETQISTGKRCKFCPTAENPDIPGEKVQMIPNETQSECVMPVTFSKEELSIHRLD